MKPFLGTEITNSKESSLPHGRELSAQDIPTSMWDSFEENETSLIASIKKGLLPFPLQFLQYASLLAGTYCTFRFAFVLAIDGFAFAYDSKPLLFWGIVISAFLFLTLTILQYKKALKHSEKSSTQETVTDYKQVRDAICKELGIPDHAAFADILVFSYKEPMEFCPYPEPKSPCLNYSVALFHDEKNLYIADMKAKYALPLASLKAIRSVERSVTLSKWNKDIPPQKNPYRPYHITVKSSGQIKVPFYHILEAEINGETYGVYFPCYEAPIFEKITKIRAEKFTL